MALFSGLGASLFFGLGGVGGITAGAASVIGTTAVAAGVGAAGAAVKGISSAMAGATPKIPGITPLPIKSVADATDAAKITATAKAISKRSAIARSRTVFTSPMGVTEEAATSKKTLLGQ